MTEATQKTPAELGYRMPPEWHPHQATWVAWPHNTDTWPDNLAAAQDEFIRMVETIAKAETVCVVASGDALQQAGERLKHVSQIEFFDIATNDAWIRDYGPTFVVNPTLGQVAGIDWRYNGWGEKYPPFLADVAAAKKICQAAAVTTFSSRYVVEGGALEINDQGDLLTTISCLLNYNRNPAPNATGPNDPVDEAQFYQHQADVSRILASMTGATSITWLSGMQIPGDDTDGHIDQQARFADTQSLILAKGSNPTDPIQADFEVMVRELATTFGGDGQALQAMDLPFPPIIELSGRRIPASYLNFYICNYGVLVPQFDSPLADARAIDLMKAAFPGRRIIGLPSLNLACGLGSFHCLTQQQPSASMSESN